MPKLLKILICAVLTTAFLSGCIGDIAHQLTVKKDPFPDTYKLTEIPEEKLKEMALAVLKEKYDENFSIRYFRARSATHCFFWGEGESLDTGYPLLFSVQYFRDRTEVHDLYFQWTIKKDYEQYMSGFIKDVIPEHKVYMGPGIHFFLDITKKISFNEFLERYGKQKNGINFNIYVKESYIRSVDANELSTKLGEVIKVTGYQGSITLYPVVDDTFTEPSKSMPFNASGYIMLGFSEGRVSVFNKLTSLKNGVGTNALESN